MKPQLELTISELSDKEYIEQVTTSWRSMYSKTAYKITEKGKRALELHTSTVKHFVSTLMKKYHDAEKDDLNDLVMENKDFFGLVTIRD